MTESPVPPTTLDARSLGFIPADGVLVRDTPFLPDVLRGVHRAVVRSAVLAPLLVLCAASLFVTTEGSLAVPVLVAFGAGMYLLWTLARVSSGRLASDRVLGTRLRSVSLMPQDIVLTRWRVALRVGGPTDRHWVCGWFPRAYREMLLRHRRVLVVQPASARRVVVIVPGSLAVFTARSRRTAPKGTHPRAATPSHTVSAIPRHDVVLSAWLAMNTWILTVAAVALPASAIFLAALSVPVLLDGGPGDDVALTYGSAVLAVLLLAATVTAVMSLRRLRTAVASASGWRCLRARLHETEPSPAGAGRYRFTATVQDADGRVEQVSARAAFADIVASIAGTGRMWVLDTGADSGNWTAGIPGHPVLDTVVRQR